MRRSAAIRNGVRGKQRTVGLYGHRNGFWIDDDSGKTLHTVLFRPRRLSNTAPRDEGLDFALDMVGAFTIDTLRASPRMVRLARMVLAEEQEGEDG